MDKIELIKAEIKRYKHNAELYLNDYTGNLIFEQQRLVMKDLLDFINSLLEEPSKVWHDASEPPKEGVDVLFEVDYIFYQSSYNARQEWFRPYYIKDSDGDDKIFLLSEVTRWAYVDELTKL